MTVPTAIHLSEWETARPKPGSQLEGVFLEPDLVASPILSRLAHAGMLTIEELRRGLAIRTTSYVGRIHLGALQITIRPKLSGFPLLHLLRYAYGLRQLELQLSAQYSLDAQAFQEILLHQLASEVEELLTRGLHRRYLRTTQPLASPRGRLDLQQVARQGGLVDASISCSWYPRQEDCLINQVVCAGLALGAQLSNDDALRLRLQRLVARLEPDISPIVLNGRTMRQVQREANRLVAAYQPALTLTLIDLILESTGISLDDDPASSRLPGFLFDMNRFFQTLVSRFLHDHLADYTIQDEYRLGQVFRYVPGFNPQQHAAPTPRPDFVVCAGAQIRAILDTKYRDLWKKSLPREMLYQLAIYALSQRGQRSATILYPTMESLAREARIAINDPVHGGSRAMVILRPIHLATIAQLIASPASSSLEAERRDYARYMVFGAGSLVNM